MLYLIATPIGNLADFSVRAIDTLQRCDLILCEDTRHSLRLLDHYQIRKPLKSFHEFNESEKVEEVIFSLKNQASIALISDAGTPLLSDPGFLLVRRCREEKISITAIPGANAAITALILSGFPPIPFQVLGFLPKKAGQLDSLLTRLLLYPGTSICYESPHRLLSTLRLIKERAPLRILCVARELTKHYEECRIASAEELFAHYSLQPPRGELVLLFSPPLKQPQFENFTTKELVAYLKKEFNMSLAEAIKLTASLQDIPKKTVYKEVHFLEE